MYRTTKFIIESAYIPGRVATNVQIGLALILTRSINVRILTDSALPGYVSKIVNNELYQVLWLKIIVYIGHPKRTALLIFANPNDMPNFFAFSIGRI